MLVEGVSGNDTTEEAMTARVKAGQPEGQTDLASTQSVTNASATAFTPANLYRTQRMNRAGSSSKQWNLSSAQRMRLSGNAVQSAQFFRQSDVQFQQVGGGDSGHHSMASFVVQNSVMPDG